MDRIFSMIGMAMKAGKVVSGEFATEKTVKTGKAFLVVVSAAASDNTKKMFRNMCSFYGVPMNTYGSKEDLGHSMGKEFRASLAVTDEGFAKSIKKRLDEAEIIAEVAE